jgi:amidohydrolase
MRAENLKEKLGEAVSSMSAELTRLSHEIHDRPELAFAEEFAASQVAGMARRNGFDVEVGGYGLATSVDARLGDGALGIGLLAEFDALPGLGHACGHNIIAAASVGAALALAPHAADLGLHLRLLGTPAEEGGGGKIRMLEAGAFDGLNAAMMVHPGPIDLPYMPTLSTTRLGVTFHGTAAHASAFPERGTNAADAAIISHVAVGLLRQQMPPETRIHGITVEAGQAPNVIPDRAVLDYMVRANDRATLEALEMRLRACFEAGATASGASLEVVRAMPIYESLAPNETLTRAFVDNAERLGRQFRDVDDRVRRAAGSTDMGNVSQVMPSIHPMIGLGRDAGVIHSPGFAEASASESADRAVLDAAIALAWTVADLALDERIRTEMMS